MAEMFSNSGLCENGKSSDIREVEDSVAVAQWKFYTILRELYKYMSLYEANEIDLPQSEEESSTPSSKEQIRVSLSASKTSLRSSKTTKRNCKSRIHFDMKSKYKIVQPYKLRSQPKPTGVIRLYGFGGHVDVKEDQFKKPVYKRGEIHKQEDWRALMKVREKKGKQNDNTPKSVTSSLRLRGPPRVAFLNSNRIFRRESLEASIQDLISENLIQELPILKQARGKEVPFVMCKSTAPSFNLAVNMQEVLYRLKQNRDLQGKSPLKKGENSCKALCPARQNGTSLARDPGNEWAVPNWEHRCICYPPKDSADYGNVLAEYSNWGSKQVRMICQKSQIDLTLLNSKIRGHVEALKLDWDNIYRSLISLSNQNDATLNHWETGAGINALEKALNEREVHYKEILQLYKEVQKAKLALTLRCLNKKKSNSSVLNNNGWNPSGLRVSRILRQILSNYSLSTVVGSLE